MKKSTAYILSLMALLGAFACNKDEETTTSPSIEGLSLEFIPAYVELGKPLNITIKTGDLYTSDGSTPEKIGVYMRINSLDRDTLSKNIGSAQEIVKDFTPEEDGTYSLSVYAFSDGYIGASASTTFQAMNPETALSGLSGSRPAGGKYREVTIGSLTWMAENLYGTGKGIYYEKCDVTDSVLGEYFSFEEASTACPSGWRLPTAEEWDSLGSDAGALMADAYLLGTRMWPHSRDVKISNTLGFNAIPAGYSDGSTIDDTGNIGLKEYAAFWTSTPGSSEAYAQYRYIYAGTPLVQKNEGSRNSLRLSVRCVK